MQGSELVVPGVRLGVARANIKQAERSDLLVIEMAEGGRCAAVFTRNAFCAAPVHLAKTHLQSAEPRYLLINSGNANAGTGERGMRDAEACCRSLAQAAACRPEQVLPFSTGVIGVNLPLERMCRAMPSALADLREAGWEAAAQAIMTTDTRPKLARREFEVDGVRAHLVGIAKGAGMICPDMATMLAYLATDLTVDAALLQSCLSEAVDPSFNSITVDGDTSTNDACVLLASGASAAPPITSRESDAYRSLADAVTSLCMELAREIVRDGEGATKLVEVAVEQAADRAEARQLAYTIAHSPLVKTALFASDPNWGRILAAVGRAGLQQIEIERVEIWLDDVCIVHGGGRAEGYTEAAGQAVMDKPEFRILVRLGRGEVQTRLLTCDLSYDYVKINAEYRT